jgi:predicted enzyme related to lactoylglutathione lyase
VTARSATTRAAGEFCWVDLKTRDVPATATFFSAALGWTFAVDRPAEARQFYERVLGLRAGTAGFAAGPAATWEVVVGVPDLAVVAQRAGTSTWVAASTELRLTDPLGLRLTVVRA